MKKHLITFLSLIAFSSLIYAQRTPLHPLDIPQGNNNLYEILDSWEPGTAPNGSNLFDDQFYISRVRPLKRISDGDYQAEKEADPNRKMCLWVPLDDPTTKWKALPRYSLEGDNFSMWSYIDIHGNWTAPWMRVSAGISDVAHKNGVKVGCVYSIPWAASVYLNSYNNYGKVFYRMFQKNPAGSATTYKYSTKLVKLMKYYGIDGLGCNSEFYTNKSFMDELIAFVKECKAEAKKIDWEFQLHWYDGTNDNGHISFDAGLSSHNDDIFGQNEPVTDMLFFNYNWSGGLLKRSAEYAESINRSSYDLYAGFDIQGKAFRNAYWQSLKDNKISIGFWGAHAQSLLHQSATDDGSSDLAIQKAYLLKQELAFSGGYRNPALTPAIRTDATLSNADLKTFHGLSTYLTAKSTLQQIPFVTRFNLGNGLSFKKEGKVTFNHKWYNLSMQDFLPTWRWWITDKKDEVTKDNIAGLIKAELTFDDAWFGGSCLKLYGESEFSRVKLFKTKFDVQPDYKISVTYKVLKGTEPKAKLFIAKKGKLTTYSEIALPATDKEGEWKTFTANLSELGVAANDVIAMIGVAVENTTAEYELLLGEIAVRKPNDNFNTVAPTITKVDILRGRYNAVDFKVYYQSKNESNGVKTYNDEVGTWYFEIYFQQKGGDEQLITATTSWAGYVIDAPLVVGGERKGRVGIRAVSPDGLQATPIVWSEYQDIPYAPVEDIETDKPVIKPGETFTLRFKDVLHKPANWIIKDPMTDKVIATANGVKKIEMTIEKEGLYDVYTTVDGKETLTRGFIQITPNETGAVPKILSFGADKQETMIGENVKYSYTSQDGEGKVSRAIRIEDPNMFMVPGKAQVGKTFSYAVWFKVFDYLHDKQGTNLINKNTIKDKWPHNNWGDLWVTIRPEWQGKSSLHPANEISFNTFGWTAHDIPNEPMMSTGYSVSPNVWNHIVITQDASNHQKMYFNGKKVAETTFDASSRRENSTDPRIDQNAVANIFFGGGGVYKAGFNGWIDEVQIWDKVLSDTEVLEAMKGYKTAPEGLKAYYTFEDVVDNTYFENKGTGGDLKGKIVKILNSGGEATATATYQTVTPVSNNELGYPGIVGSLEVKTTPEWKLAGATLPMDTKMKQIDVVYEKDGTYNATLTLTNMWGETTVEKANYIVVKRNAGVDTQGQINFTAYPNPFVDEVNLQFELGGKYDVEVLDMNGKSVYGVNVDVAASEFVKVRLNIPAGNYILQISQKGKLLKALKVFKK